MKHRLYQLNRIDTTDGTVINTNKLYTFKREKEKQKAIEECKKQILFWKRELNKRERRIKCV